MKKVLFVASVTIHINTFHIPYLKMFKDAGYEVHVASNGEEKIEYADKHFNLNFSRSPFNKDNIKAYKELKKIIEKENYNVIQCNTPVASVLTRLAAKNKRKSGTRVIYMAHGFHFYKGAPLKNWLIYYPIEKYLSKYTDDLITINKEDFEFAKKKIKAKNIHQIHGIGVDKTKFDTSLSEEERQQLKSSLRIEKDDFVMAFVGELNENKNQIILIEAMKDLVKENNKFKLLLAGQGSLKEYYEEKIKEYNLEKNVYLLGYRKDIQKLLQVINLYISMSKREGLGLNLIEAKIAKIPTIASINRGHKEIIKNNEDGFLIVANDCENLKNKIRELYRNKELRKQFIINSNKNIEKFYLENVYEEVKKIYIK